MNILLLTASSLPAGEIPVLIWATIGGILVFVGLAVEKFADWMNDRYLGGPEKPHKPLETAGWCILMLGIFIEIAVAGMSANDAWETRQIAIKNDPRNQPIKSVTAVATLYFAENVLVSNKWVESVIPQNRWENPLQMRLFSKHGYDIELYCDAPPPPITEYQVGNNRLLDSNSISIHLSGDAAMRQPFSMRWNSLVGATNLTAGEIADSGFEDVSLTPSFLRAGTVVLGGSVEVWFNAPSVERDFSIPPQLIEDWEFAFLKCLPATNVVQPPTK